MPYALKHPCKGCRKALTVEPYCEACMAAGKGKDTRPNSGKRLYNAAWRRRSKAWLKQPGHQFCVGYPEGYHGDRLVAAKLPDHIKAHKGNVELFWDEDNWQPMCIGCNSRKAVSEEGAGWRHEGM